MFQNGSKKVVTYSMKPSASNETSAAKVRLKFNAQKENYSMCLIFCWSADRSKKKLCQKE
ncbi:hypothetical protein A4V04_08540 [Burkholderiales bacterium YL45]|uniref:Uncharacterized protein n=1 Tax=Turicimonas muris TaxID=1796652 RepID=A0A227KDS1_9BURK|nr:hypothetical protein A4V04_08540 [Burkholderiales bacterium YL45]OXE45587.1 hypothetical protein ADH67_10545 [Turicimonas muris]